MQVKRGFVAAVVLAGGLVAGFSMVNAAGSAGPKLESTSWELEELNGAALPELPGGMARVPGISFAEGGQFSATAGCNLMNGTAGISGASITFPDQMAATMMACPPPLDELEQSLVAGLSAVAQMRLDGDRLVFLDSAGAAVMAFRAAD